ncbi:MAG: hypothetical protein LC792_03535 [Actinobacteria bacterium]|nr:hypothetical protein [Actinomycetota bacterium]
MSGALGTDKDVEGLARRARRAGWTVSIDGSTHIRWQGPEGGEFRSPLTGGPSTRLRVEKRLAALDPRTFGRVGTDPVPEPDPVPFATEVAVAVDELRAAAELLETLGPAGDVTTAVRFVRETRAVLRSVEEDLLRLDRGRRGGRR